MKILTSMVDSGARNPALKGTVTTTLHDVRRGHTPYEEYQMWLSSCKLAVDVGQITDYLVAYFGGDEL